MSGIKFKGDTSGEILLETPAVAGTNTLTLPAETGTLATTTEVNNVYNHLGMRNLIINGDMSIAQRAKTSSATTNVYHTVDRWLMGSTSINITQEQVELTASDTPYSSGLRFASKITNTSVSSDSTSWAEFRYITEAQHIAQSGLNYTDSSSHITLSFWIKTSESGLYYGYIKSND